VIADRGLADELRKPKYAHLELERRWLVDAARRPSLECHPATIIEDRYLDATRMRLRRMTRPDAGEVVWKLTKKYESADPSARPIVTSYLIEAEYQVLSVLPAHELTKRRHRLTLEGRIWSLDVFEGELRGLEMIECEVDDQADLAAVAPPDWALREVTHLPQWQCGALAAAGAIPEDRWRNS
jgi:CYTH domain-containing protein